MAIFSLGMSSHYALAARAATRRLTLCWAGVRDDLATHIAAPGRADARDQIPRLHPRITIHSERELTVEIIAGGGAGFSDTGGYEAVPVRDGSVMLSWQEHIGTTVVPTLDLASSQVYTAVTPANGNFMRLTGRLEAKAEPWPFGRKACWRTRQNGVQSSMPNP